MALNVSAGTFFWCNPVTHTWQSPFTNTPNFTQGLIAPTIGPSANQQHTIPAVSSDTFGLLAATQTFSNKTFTSPTITNPSTTGTDSGSETLSNKTLTGASSGNSVSMLNAQANSGAITGTGSAATYFTYSLPANMVANLKGIRFTVGATHAGSSSVSYTATLNGQNLYTFSTNALGPLFTGTILNTGATTGTVSAYSVPSSSDSVASLSSLNWSGAQTLSFLFNVAASDSVTPIQLIVELIQ